MSINSDFVQTEVTVTTYARLHLGFFDLSLSAYRKFGGWGVAIDAFKTKVHVSTHSNFEMQDSWVNMLLSQQYTGMGMMQSSDIRAHVLESIPRHFGLGSGTQMALALGTALQALKGLPVNAELAARYAARGRRSGIGIATFKQGGLIVDGGVSNDKQLPPVLSRIAFPEDWCFLLILDRAYSGLHGEQEKQAFVELKPAALTATEKLAHRCLMQGIPALIEHNFVEFSAALGAVQDYNANYFAPAQGGMYASKLVSEVLEYLKKQGYSGVGQSSWGPTGFVLLPSNAEAQQLLNDLRDVFSAPSLDFLISHAINHGHEVNFD